MGNCPENVFIYNVDIKPYCKLNAEASKWMNYSRESITNQFARFPWRPGKADHHHNPSLICHSLAILQKGKNTQRTSKMACTITFKILLCTESESSSLVLIAHSPSILPTMVKAQHDPQEPYKACTQWKSGASHKGQKEEHWLVSLQVLQHCDHASQKHQEGSQLGSEQV